MTIAATPEAPSEDDRASLYTKLVIAVFFLFLFIPGSFYLGVRLTPMRVFLLVMIVPAILRLLNDPTIRPTFVDGLVLAMTLWRCLGIFVNHGTSETVFAVSLFLETIGGYAIGRAFIRNAADFRFVFKVFLFVLLAFTPLALLEFATNKRVWLDLAGTVLEQSPPPAPAQGMRFGLTRVILAFGHPTLFGAVCAMAFVNVYYVLRPPLNVVAMALVGFLGMLTISSSTIITMSLQLFLIVYSFVFRAFPKKWVVLILGATALSLSFEVFVGMSVLDFVISQVMFNPISGESRALHFQFALREVMRNPFFGVGLGEWGAPFWLSQVTDSYWLSVMLRSGLIVLALTAILFVWHFLKVAYAGNLSDVESRLRLGYNITLGASFVMFFYTSFYNTTFIFYMMYIGAGAWFYQNGFKTAGPRVSRKGPPRAGTRSASNRVPARSFGVDMAGRSRGAGRR